jgi:hypothetical protein
LTADADDLSEVDRALRGVALGKHLPATASAAAAESPFAEHRAAATTLTATCSSAHEQLPFAAIDPEGDHEAMAGAIVVA